MPPTKTELWRKKIDNDEDDADSVGKFHDYFKFAVCRKGENNYWKQIFFLSTTAKKSKN